MAERSNPMIINRVSELSTPLWTKWWIIVDNLVEKCVQVYNRLYLGSRKMNSIRKSGKLIYQQRDGQTECG